MFAELLIAEEPSLYIDGLPVDFISSGDGIFIAPTPVGAFTNRDNSVFGSNDNYFLLSLIYRGP